MSFGMLFYQKQEPYIVRWRHVPYLMITQNFLRPNNGTKRKTGHGIGCKNITINNTFLMHKLFNIIILSLKLKLYMKIPQSNYQHVRHLLPKCQNKFHDFLTNHLSIWRDNKKYLRIFLPKLHISLIVKDFHHINTFSI